MEGVFETEALGDIAYREAIVHENRRGGFYFEPSEILKGRHAKLLAEQAYEMLFGQAEAAGYFPASQLFPHRASHERQGSFDMLISYGEPLSGLGSAFGVSIPPEEQPHEGKFGRPFVLLRSSLEEPIEVLEQESVPGLDGDGAVPRMPEMGEKGQDFLIGWTAFLGLKENGVIA